MVTIDSGQLPSAEGVDEGHELSQVVRQWAIIANGKFPTDCSKLLEIIEETDRLEIWKKNVGGFTFESRNEFLEKRVLLDFDLTEQSLTDIVAALKKGEPVKLTKREEVIELAKSTEVIIERGSYEVGAGRGTEEENTIHDKTNNVMYHSGPSGQCGNSSKYRIAKLKRDHPEVAQQLIDGEFKSVSEAERAAGIARPLLSNVEKVIRAYGRLSEDEKVEFKLTINQ